MERMQSEVGWCFNFMKFLTLSVYSYWMKNKLSATSSASTIQVKCDILMSQILIGCPFLSHYFRVKTSVAKPFPCKLTSGSHSMIGGVWRYREQDITIRLSQSQKHKDPVRSKCIEITPHYDTAQVNCAAVSQLCHAIHYIIPLVNRPICQLSLAVNSTCYWLDYYWSLLQSSY